MSSPLTDSGFPPIHHPYASAVYEWLAGQRSMPRMMNPLREEVAGRASRRVLEVGAGSGRNYPYYSPERVERVEAVEPDAAMLRYARKRLAQAHVPITLVQASAEALPFAEASFEGAVATLVFCSVSTHSKRCANSCACSRQEITFCSSSMCVRAIGAPPGFKICWCHSRHDWLAIVIGTVILNTW